MINIFIDTDIILDLLAKREPFYQNAAKLFLEIEKGKIAGFVSPLSFANLSYILKRLKSREFAQNCLLKLKLLLKITALDERIMELALASDFKDFEDAIQYYSAVQSGIECLITRNKKDYRNAKIQILSPDEFLQNLQVQ
jgi:predicted nucleic acid-binding protein